MKYLGIDYGLKRVGIALSDEEGRVAFPRETKSNSPTLPDDIVALIKAAHVDAVVIGESRDFSGKENPLMVQVRGFADALKEKTRLPVHFSPEVLTSAAATRPPAGASKPSARRTPLKRRGPLDAAAAALILQGYLDTIRRP